MLLLDNFINANIAIITKIDVGQGHIFYINYVIRLIDISEDSK